MSHRSICPQCKGEGCASCINGIVYKRTRRYVSSAGHSAGNTRPGAAGWTEPEPHGNETDPRRNVVKLYRIGFETRRLPGEGSW